MSDPFRLALGQCRQIKGASTDVPDPALTDAFYSTSFLVKKQNQNRQEQELYTSPRSLELPA